MQMQRVVLQIIANSTYDEKGAFYRLLYFFTLLRSTTFTVPKGVKKIDAFCVGGGGGGSNYYDSHSSTDNSGTTTTYVTIGGGGGGGYTTTQLNTEVTPGQQLSIVVGNGGPVSSFSDASGGTSSVGDICSANGGNTGGSNVGGNGGSGGGAGYGSGMYYTSGFSGGLGGKDGGDGQSTSNPFSINGGKGQHSTTRYFGESAGTLYSAGGCGTGLWSLLKGGWYNVPSSNTGDGGSAGILGSDSRIGGSGICIIRWDDQKS